MLFSQSTDFSLTLLEKVLGAALGIVISAPMVGVLARYASRFTVRAFDLTVDPSLFFIGAPLAVAAAWPCDHPHPRRRARVQDDRLPRPGDRAPPLPVARPRGARLAQGSGTTSKLAGGSPRRWRSTIRR